MVQAPDLPGTVLHDRVVERDLAVAGEDGAIFQPQRKNRRAVEHVGQEPLAWRDRGRYAA